jgi:hypothetical protein
MGIGTKYAALQPHAVAPQQLPKRASSPGLSLKIT